MRVQLFFCSLVMLGIAAPAWAQDDVTRDPGYVDFGRIEQWFDREPKLEVNIKGVLLELVAEASRNEDPELADLLRRLKAIQVRGFALDRDQYGDVERRTSELAQRLERQGWETFARVREDDERVDMFVRTRDGAIAGLVVMVVSPGEDESVFVNIVGDIRPEQIGRIGRKFDIGPLGGSVTRKEE